MFVSVSMIAVLALPSATADKRPTTLKEFAEVAKDGPLPPWMPFIGQKRVEDVRKRGTVVSVVADGIELQIPGEKGTVKYPPHELLASGAICHWETDKYCYLLDDVKKGDLVTIGVGVVEKKRGEECFYISIGERPDGVVPPSRKLSVAKPYHIEREYQLFYERKGEKTPEELQTAEEKRKFLIEKGVPLKAGSTRETAPKK